VAILDENTNHNGVLSTLTIQDQRAAFETLFNADVKKELGL
jgi:tagatose-1,6-bisphosphate aldolase